MSARSNSEQTTISIAQKNDFTITAKNSSDWTWDELDHFRVLFRSLDFRTFFRQEPDVLGPEWDAWLTAENELDAVDDEKAWSVLEKVSELHDGFAHFGDRMVLIDTLPNELFQLFGYIIPGKIRNRMSCATRFTMCGQSCTTIIDNALLDVDTTHAVRGILQIEPTKNLAAQVVAQALAVFTYNNKLRKTSLTEVLVPVITMYHNGSSPIFYLVPITQTFADDVAAGRFPDHETVILTYEPIPETKTITFNLGLAATANRLPITQAYLAFRKFLLKPSGESPFPFDRAVSHSSLQKGGCAM